jgi:hypothetical protein
LDTLAGVDLGELVFLPRVMFDSTGLVTLDDLARDEVEDNLGVRVALASRMSEIVKILATH